MCNCVRDDTMDSDTIDITVLKKVERVPVLVSAEGVFIEQ